jgi:RimJ/RimL family protein N-acetyltransferase
MDKFFLQTNRLIIRNFEKKDAEGLLRLLSNPRVNCFVHEKIDTLDEAYQHIAKSNTEYDFAVCLKDSDIFIGTLFGLKEEPDSFFPCWNFLMEYCGQGYAREATKAYFNYLFHDKGMRRLYAYTEDDNMASQNVCRKLGMRQEGLFKEFISFVNNPDGTPKYENTLQFAILKKEWETHCVGTILFP